MAVLLRMLLPRDHTVIHTRDLLRLAAVPTSRRSRTRTLLYVQLIVNHSSSRSSDVQPNVYCIRFIRLFLFCNRLQYSLRNASAESCIDQPDRPLPSSTKSRINADRFLKQTTLIELPLVGTLLYHTLTGRFQHRAFIHRRCYYHNPFHRSPRGRRRTIL